MGQAILIPELVIYEMLNNAINMTIENYTNISNKNDTILYYIFGKDENDRPLKLGKMLLFEQAVDILINGGKDKKRKVEVTVGYNLQRLAVPTLHITMPSESPINAGIGDNEGYTEAVVDNVNKITYRTVTQDASVTYNILITSDNVNEVLILYGFLKAVFLGMKSQLELRGFKNVVSGGSDLNISDELVPPNIFHRNFNVSFTYDYTTVDPFGAKFGTGFKVELTPNPTTEE